ncbi:hypothetical protein A2841_03835 [Candidatus Kaiserbacteria bacterium RIFCSPHIGHO2_01_FULL_48_10]|uniref:Uncharacterized protein n=1 Tax=Candidatus Kaiserbacteria bacterium RIFCSPHIGHO2_01_FULL_48_10 TaxID=1798476 RepID=A0A1F6C261_9BACT|nr:MAG: hypothetical protein A2841_03835 [Candidatus Kaiserbacteria bacterium RIFCSPHIGHO2_01_FULL_48_10]
MKFLYAGVLVFLAGASTVAFAQQSAVSAIAVSAAGYTCRVTGGSILSFTATCNKTVQPAAARASIPKINAPAANSPFGTTLAIGSRLYGSDPFNEVLTCNNNIVINLLQQCPTIPNFLQYAAIQCVRQKHPDSCGRTSVGDCCLSFPQASRASQ